MIANNIVAVVGMPGSGKSEVCKILITCGYTRVYFGDATFEEMTRRGLALTEANERLIREEIRKEHGMAAFAIRNMDKLRSEAKKGNVVIESLYSWEEFLAVEEEFGSLFKVIAVHTPKSERYAKLAMRPKRPLTYAEAISRDKSQIENLHTGGPIAFADHMIVNDGTLTDLHEKVKRTLRLIEKSK